MNAMKVRFIFFTLLFFSLSPFFSDDLTRERVRLIESQAEEVGVQKIDTFKRVFAYHDEVNNAIIERTGIEPDYYALSFQTNKLNSFVLNNRDPYMIIEEHPGDDYLFTIPVIYDYCVMISRIDDRLELLNDIQNKTYATFKSDIISGEWCRELGLSRFDDDNLLGSSAFQKIVDGKADLIFMPQKLATVIIDLMDFRDELYVSRPIFEISYRFAFKAEHKKEWEELNSILVEMIHNGELSKLCKKYNLQLSLSAPKNIQRELMFYVIIFLIIVLLLETFILMASLKKKRNDVENSL